jgi:hypothetical protein
MKRNKTDVGHNARSERLAQNAVLHQRHDIASKLDVQLEAIAVAYMTDPVFTVCRADEKLWDATNEGSNTFIHSC